MSYGSLWSCVVSKSQTRNPQILKSRRGGWRCSTVCRRCHRVNYHSKHMNWVPAQCSWAAIGVTWLTSDEMQEHYEQIQHWRNKKPQFAAGASRKEGGDHGDDQRPVTFA